MKFTLRIVIAALGLLALALPAGATADRGQGGGRTLFVRSAVENAGDTVTLPLHRGTSQNRTVWYVILDSSSGADADRLGVNRSQKLANARNTGAVQQVQVVNDTVDFPASVDFTPVRMVVPGPNGFPPAVAEPGSVGENRLQPAHPALERDDQKRSADCQRHRSARQGGFDRLREPPRDAARDAWLPGRT